MIVSEVRQEEERRLERVRQQRERLEKLASDRAGNAA